MAKQCNPLELTIFAEHVVPRRFATQCGCHHGRHSSHLSRSRSAHEKSRARRGRRNSSQLNQLLANIRVVSRAAVQNSGLQYTCNCNYMFVGRLVYSSINVKHMVYMSVSCDYATLILNCIGFYSLRVFLVCLDNFYDVTFETSAEVSTLRMHFTRLHLQDTGV